VPVPVRFANGTEHLRLIFKPLLDAPATPPTYLLVTLQTRSLANRRMLDLKRELASSKQRQARLKADNRKLTTTVEVELPALKELSNTDPLTKLANRRSFDARMTSEWKRSVRNGNPVSLIYADIDRFKLYNDTYGHHRGDECIRAVATALRECLVREFDVACRIGGEEFALLIPMTGSQGALEVAKRARSMVLDLAIPHPDPRHAVVTLSFGVGTCNPTEKDIMKDFMVSVDKTLYKAKDMGRDRIVQLKRHPKSAQCDSPGRAAQSEEQTSAPDSPSSSAGYH
jgi:diguanylate cyclase (GGDEF)-like protein